MSENKLSGTAKNNDIEKNKMQAFLSYFWLFSLIIYLTNKKSKFAQFHAKQGLVIFALSFFSIVPFFGWMFSMVLLVFSIIAMTKAYQGEWYKIPFIYDISKKIKF